MREKFATMSERPSDNMEEIDEIDTLSATETDEKEREENKKVITWLEPWRIRFTIHCINGLSLYKCYLFACIIAK